MEYNSHVPMGYRSIIKAMLAKPSDFDTVWEKYMADLDAAGVSEMEKQKNLLVDRKIRLFTEN